MVSLASLTTKSRITVTLKRRPAKQKHCPWPLSFASSSAHPVYIVVLYSQTQASSKIVVLQKIKAIVDRYV